MYFLLWLFIALYFGCLAACNVCFAARMPGAISRWLAIIFSCIALAAGLGFGAHYFWNWLDTTGKWMIILHANTIKAWVATVLATFAILTILGFKKRGDVLLAAQWPIPNLVTGAVLCLAFIGMLIGKHEEIVINELRQEDADAVKSLKSQFGPVVPSQDNAWLAYQRSPAFNDRKYPTGGFEPLTDAEIRSIRVQRRLDARELREIAALPSFQTPTTYLLPSSTEARFDLVAFGGFYDRLQSSFQFDANLSIEQREPQEAVLDILALRRIAEHLSQHESNLERLSFSCEMERSTFDQIERLIKQHAFSAEDLIKISPTLPHFARGRLASAKEINAQLRRREIVRSCQASFGHTVRRWPFPRREIAFPDFVSRFKIAHLKRDIEYSRTFDLTLPAKELLRSLPSDKKLFDDQFIVTLQLAQTCRKVISIEVRIGLAQVGIAAYRFALKEHRFPDSLEELQTFDSSVNIIDPCSGEPFLFTHQGRNLVVGSVGAYGEDYDRDLIFWALCKTFTVTLPPE